MSNEKPSPFRVAAKGSATHKARKPRRIGHVGQAFLEAQEAQARVLAERRETAARAMARMHKAAA